MGEYQDLSPFNQERPLARWVIKQSIKHKQRPLPIRVLSVIAGFILTALGFLLLILPGPAFVVLPPGLALLALEFDWAMKLLIKAEEYLAKAREKGKTASFGQRIGAALMVIVGISMVIGVLIIL